MNTDMMVLVRDKVYVVEIKTDAQEPAIKQIEERRYWRSMRGRWKDICSGDKCRC